MICPVCHRRESWRNPLIDVPHHVYRKVHKRCLRTFQWKVHWECVEDQTPYIAYLLTCLASFIIFLQFIERLS